MVWVALFTGERLTITITFDSIICMNNYTQRPEGTYFANPTWYEGRNAEIYKDKMSGMGNTELVTKYQISLGRIAQLFNKEVKKHG